MKNKLFAVELTHEDGLKEILPSTVSYDDSAVDADVQMIKRFFPSRKVEAKELVAVPL